MFDNPVYLSNINLNFANSTISGKSITDSEINPIIDYGFTTFGNVI